jgi:hypothetical protein
LFLVVVASCGSFLLYLVRVIVYCGYGFV